EVERQRLLRFVGLLVAEDVLFADGGRSLQRRAGGVVPDTLQIRIAPGCLGRAELFRRLSRRRGDEAHRDNHGEQGSRCEESVAHGSHLAACLRNLPNRSSSVKGTHLNSRSWTFFSIRR